MSTQNLSTPPIANQAAPPDTPPPPLPDIPEEELHRLNQARKEREAAERLQKQEARNINRIVRFFNTRHAVIIAGDNLGDIASETANHKGIRKVRIHSIAALKRAFGRRKILLTNKEGKRVPVSCVDVWLGHKSIREITEIVFDPRWHKTRKGFMNIYGGFRRERYATRWDLFECHMRDIICDGNEDNFHYTMAWLADIIQRPTALPGVAIALRGEQGTGKGLFVREFGHLLGPHFIPIVSTRLLTGRFNHHLHGKLLAFLDEAFWGGRNQEDNGQLKAMITEPTMLLEAKGCDAIDIDNYLHVIISSNNTWVAPTDIHDRRFFVMDVNNQFAKRDDPEHAKKSKAYFDPIYQQMATGGREAFLDSLQTYNLDGIDLRDFPMTEARNEQRMLGSDPFIKWLVSILDYGELGETIMEYSPNLWEDGPVEVGRDHFRDLYHTFCKRVGGECLADHRFGIAIHKFLPTKDGRSTKPVNSMNGNAARQAYTYIFPTLADCRARFIQELGFNPFSQS